MQPRSSFVSLCLVRYPKGFAWLGLFSMAIHRLPLAINKHISFFKLMGTGKGDAFDFRPDWNRWAMLCVHKNELPSFEPNAAVATHQLMNDLFGGFIAGWYRLFKCNIQWLIMEVGTCHGKWNGQQPFFVQKAAHDASENVAVLTRATIHFNSASRFWKHAAVFNEEMAKMPGLQFSMGMGEMPWLRQATFSIWENTDKMKNFAYQNLHHQDVIQKTRNEAWYKEELFARMRIVHRSSHWNKAGF